MKIVIAILFSVLAIVGCDRDENNGVSLEAAEARLFQQGVQLEYTQNFNGRSNNGRDATCVDLYDVDLRGINRTADAASRVIEALQLYRTVLLNGSNCVTDRSFSENVIYDAINRLDRCRSRWSDGLRCARI